jgi:nucleoside-diphosphate-sugar epimerase
MHVFLAGATGIVGRRIVPLLTAAGHTVTAFVRDPERAVRVLGEDATLIPGDVMDAPAVRSAVASAQPDVVMNQLTDLAEGSLASNARLRIEGTRHLVDAASAAGVRSFVTQSIAWAYAPGQTPADETTPLDVDADEPRHTTIEGVVALEQAARRMPRWVVLRYGLFYGPDTWYWSDGRFGAAAREGRLESTYDITSFVHIDDAAAAAVQALHWPSGPVNICDDDPAAGTEWIPAFCGAVGAPGPPQPPLPERAGFARGAHNTYARRTLGWEPRWPSWRDGFAGLGPPAS